MCSVAEDADVVERHARPVEAFEPGKRPCQKCREAMSVIRVRRKDVYCRGCFVAAMNHKYRSTLGKNKAMRPGDRVLVCFDASPSGLALLHLNRSSEDESSSGQKRRFVFTTDVVFIDDGGALGKSECDRESRTAGILVMAEKLGFGSIMVTSLEHAVSDSDQVPLIRSDLILSAMGPEGPILPSAHDRARLQELFSGIKDPTAKKSLLGHLKRKLLTRIAKENRFGKIFTSESSTSLAVTLLSGIATGRGMQIPSDVGFRDSTDPEVEVIRPMREFSSEEIEHYNAFHEHGSGFAKQTFDDDDGGGGIQRLTSSFVIALQENFTATIPTVFRTGEKLQQASLTSTTSSSTLEDSGCLLCNGITDTSTEEPCALQATRFSKIVSESGAVRLTEEFLRSVEKVRLSTEEEKCNEEVEYEESLPVQDIEEQDCSGGGCGAAGGSGCCSAKESINGGPSREDVEKELCYSCRVTVSCIKSMPEFLLKEAGKRTRRRATKEQIQDFLL